MPYTKTWGMGPTYDPGDPQGPGGIGYLHTLESRHQWQGDMNGVGIFGNCGKLSEINMQPQDFNELLNFWLSRYTYDGKILGQPPFMKTKFSGKIEAENIERKKAERQEKWKRDGLCTKCGGKIGLLGKCKNCKSK